MYIAKDFGYEWKVYPEEFENMRIVDARRILHFDKKDFPTINDVRECISKYFMKEVREVGA